jgi:anti-sigma factor (TIGR02949 family)
VICAEVDTCVQTYVDGELAGVDREGVERHLVGCPACAGRVRLEARFKAAVRAHLPRPAVPAALRLRIEQTLASQPIAPLRGPWLS